MFGFFEFTSHNALETFLAQQGIKAKLEELPAFTHIFTHFELTITPIVAQLSEVPDVVHEQQLLWFDLHQPPAVGLATPTKKLVKLMATLG